MNEQCTEHKLFLERIVHLNEKLNSICEHHENFVNKYMENHEKTAKEATRYYGKVDTLEKNFEFIRNSSVIIISGIIGLAVLWGITQNKLATLEKFIRIEVPQAYANNLK